MSFSYQAIDLPVREVVPQVQEQLAQHNTLIVKAPPGAGKSTLLPLALMDEPWLEGKKIYMLEPRRLAARSIAYRMAELLGEKVGETVGYRVRFDSQVGPNTRIEILTEGILTRMIHSDNALEGVGMVIFDEFHERSLHADLAMAFCRESQQLIREDLRILVMSATLDMPQLAKGLSAPVVQSDGRQHPVDIHYGEEVDQRLMADLTARKVIQVANQHDGDLLVFLPGQGEIRQVEELLQPLRGAFRIMPLYGQLPIRQQQAALFPDKEGRRKVVLATSIAETSLTIEGISVVIDTGFGRVSQFDPNTGLSRLTTICISKDAADQRAGRAGRLGPGVCYRMWTRASQERLSEHRLPEIEQADLASMRLDLAAWGIEDVQEMFWLSPPPAGHLAQAEQTLEDLEVLVDGVVTDHGHQVHKLPCHPRIAHMLIRAEEHDLLPLASDLAALLEERDPLPKEAGTDINLRVEALRRFRKDSGKNRRFVHISKLADSYRRIFEVREDNGAVDMFETGWLLANAYPERIACARPGNNAQFQLANGKIAMIGHRDDLAHESWLAVAHIDAREGMGKIFMASPMDPKELASMVKEKETVKWDVEEGAIVANKELRIGSIILRSVPIPLDDEEMIATAILEAIPKHGQQMLDFSEEVQQLQARIGSLRQWNPDQSWPDYSTATLLTTADRWLSPYLKGIKKEHQLRKLNLKDILTHALEYEHQQELDSLAPERIEVPSGSKIKLDYQQDGSPAVLAVRLQEVFGLAETPKLNGGKNAVLMHLLSPGFKPVQITGDLKSFWENAYFEVKKDLKRRYPKHSWPEDPWTEEAVRGVKRKQQ
ncbi:ATP-dependent helicase HrpB [Persicobacter diffluens]|uniref:ATP-dependent helicase HrpB n=1 Tax=Persicobacter diffluens TaxID=981 RepID=A0AAN4W1Q9_9BACT|nr:ATP-dependent helicase HrpB [Persicobacter diffluens]